MTPIKIFDIKNICNTMDTKIFGLINVKHIFSSDQELITKIINNFIEGDTFKIVLHFIGKKYSVDSTLMAQYHHTKDSLYEGWYLHPVLIKTVLRHIDHSISKTLIVKTIYESEKFITYGYTMNQSLLSIVDKIKKPDTIKQRNKDEKYNCKEIDDMNDMFNDDKLYAACAQYIIDIMAILPKCLCDMVILYL
jgi:hypothetical protein